MAYPSKTDTVGIEKPELREVGRRRARDVSTGPASRGSSLGEGVAVVAAEARPFTTRRDALLEASVARRGGRRGHTEAGGLLDRGGRGPCRHVALDGSGALSERG